VKPRLLVTLSREEARALSREAEAQSVLAHVQLQEEIESFWAAIDNKLRAAIESPQQRPYEEALAKIAHEAVDAPHCREIARAALNTPQSPDAACERCKGKKRICSECGGPWSERHQVCNGKVADPVACPDCKPDTGRYEEALRALVKTIDWAEQQDEWGDDFEASVLAARDTAKAALQPSGEKHG
jgi:hypothetical protein